MRVGCVGCVRCVGAHEHDSFPVGRNRIYESELYEMTMVRRVRAVFHVGGRAGRWRRVVVERKNPVEKKTRRRRAQRPREKNFGALTLELHAPRLTYCEMRCFFRFSFYFFPSQGNRETIFPRFSLHPHNSSDSADIE